MRVRYSATASADLTGIVSYLEERNPRAAAAVGRTIETTMDRIAAFPDSAQTTDAPGIRAAPAGRYPYLIFYLVENGEMLIVRILHGARLRPWQTNDPD